MKTSVVVWNAALVHVCSFTCCQFICFHPRVTSVFSRLFPRPVLLLVSSCLCSSCVLWFWLSSPVPLGFTLSYVWVFLWVTPASFCCLPLVASLCHLDFSWVILFFTHLSLCMQTFEQTQLCATYLSIRGLTRQDFRLLWSSFAYKLSTNE